MVGQSRKGLGPPTASAAERFQLSPICEGTVNEVSQAVHGGKARTDVSMKAHLGIRVPAGTGSGNLEQAS